MRISKKFIPLGRSSAVVIPKDWINSQETISGKKMIGVHIDVNEGIKMTPMWGRKKRKSKK